MGIEKGSRELGSPMSKLGEGTPLGSILDEMVDNYIKFFDNGDTGTLDSIVSLRLVLNSALDSMLDRNVAVLQFPVIRDNDTFIVNDTYWRILSIGSGGFGDNVVVVLVREDASNSYEAEDEWILSFPEFVRLFELESRFGRPDSRPVDEIVVPEGVTVPRIGKHGRVEPYLGDGDVSRFDRGYDGVLEPTSYRGCKARR